MQPKRILIVDDEPYIREVTQICLATTAGWTVLMAESGPLGIAMAEQEQPDAILLDFMMPGMDGFSTFKQLQANPQTRAIPVILLTAKVSLNDRNPDDLQGITAAIAKPFDPLNLPRQISQLLGWPLEAV